MQKQRQRVKRGRSINRKKGNSKTHAKSKENEVGKSRGKCRSNESSKSRLQIRYAKVRAK